jgi:crotonyl-CoA carboxylase/reductase
MARPEDAMQLEVVDTWKLDSHEVLVLVMAAGVNYNGVWAGLGQPISPFDGHKQPYHIAGSDAAGIVWAVGDKVKRWKVGDEVVDPLQPGRRRRRGMQRRRPDVQPDPADLGL